MKKKLLLLLFLLCSGFTLHTFLSTYQYIPAFKSYITPNLKISNDLLNDYYNNTFNDEASKSIMVTTLKNLDYKQWLELTDYIQLHVYKSNIIPDEEEELIVALNLSKDLAAIAIYTRIDDQYVFSHGIENLLPIRSIQFLPVKNLGYNLLITDQLLDEKLGAFYLEEFVEIFLYSNKDFKSIFKKTKYLNEIYNAQWIDPNAPSNEWFQIIEDNIIHFDNTDHLSISVSINRRKLKTIKDVVPNEEDFKLIEDVITQENFHWNKTYQNFIMTLATLNHSNTQVAILDDTSHWLESFIGFSSNNYKIITENGETMYIDKNNVNLGNE